MVFCSRGRQCFHLFSLITCFLGSQGVSCFFFSSPFWLDLFSRVDRHGLLLRETKKKKQRHREILRNKNCSDRRFLGEREEVRNDLRRLGATMEEYHRPCDEVGFNADEAHNIVKEVSYVSCLSWRLMRWWNFLKLCFHFQYKVKSLSIKQDF